MEEPNLSSLLQNLFTPKAMENFRVPTKNATIYIQKGKDSEPEELSIDVLYPFMTIQDIKTYIYISKDREEEYHPSFQALLIPLDAEPSAKQAESYIPLDFAFVELGKKNKILSTLSLLNPFQRISPEKDVDNRFVTANGDRKILKISDRSTNTIEDVFSDVFVGKNIVLHLFLYSDVLQGQDESLLKTKREWNGRVYPYYPDLPENYEDALEDEKEKRYLQAKVNYVTNTLNQMDNLNGLIEDRIVTLEATQVVAVKYLRLFWKKPFTQVPDVETLFYQLQATPDMPFVRILPSQSVPITKLYVDSPLRIPAFDPRLIEQWAQIKGPSKDDFLFGKVKIREKDMGQDTLFGTLRIFDDRSADFVIQPPKNIQKLLIRDIQGFPVFLDRALQDSYLKGEEIDLQEAALVCGIKSIGLKQVSQKTFLKRLKAFAPLFQIIPALPRESPLVMLRYRAVSKYTAEDKIFTFLTQYNTRLVVTGEIDEESGVNMIYALMDTFKIRYEEARTAYTKWVTEKDKQAINNAETKDFGPLYNKGIDIAVFAQQSSYSFHLYRVDSFTSLRRILTALSLLLSGDDSDFVVDAAAVAELEEAASVIDDEQKEEAPKGDEEAGDDVDAGLLGYYEGEGEGEQEAASVTTNTKSKAAPAPKVKEEEEVLSQAKPIREYFTKRLYDADPQLFAPTQGLVRKGKEKEETGKKAKSSRQTDTKQTYSTKCQSSNDRQPIVMKDEQYEAMLEEYKADDVTFLEFPLSTDAKLEAAGEVIPVLRYGSSSVNMNYYLCCKYFCLKDYMLVLEKDFLGTSFRPPRYEDDGSEILKEPKTCPFCEGREIINKTNPGPNEWVYKRQPDKNYIKLLSRSVQQEGRRQPCCFTTMPKYRVTDIEFEHLSYRARTEEDEEQEEVETTVSTAGQKQPPNYELSIVNAYKKYIVEKNKIPLEVGDKGGPQLGLLPTILDSFFQQSDDLIVHRPKQKQELKPDSKAFLRIGVDNSVNNRPESFFAAVAPFLKRNTPDDLRRVLLERILPRPYLFLNYGNLLLEFYNPSDAGPTYQDLQLWSQKNLEVELSDENKPSVLRLWKSYHRFREFILSKTTLKEYRQFAQMLALPGFLSVRGVIFIILDIVKDGDGERLEIRCPPFGYDNEQYADADIGFLMHHHTGIWEPIFYSENERAHKQFGDRHASTLNFQRSLIANWPLIVQKRVLEFTQKCAGPGRAAWTSASLVDSFALIPVSRAIQGIAQSPEGIVRDSYNHIVALTFRVEAGKNRLVTVPVVDDGTILSPARLHFDWDDYTSATVDAVIRFYQENIEPIFTYYPGYTIKYKVKNVTTGKIVAVQLANGLYIPCLPIKGEIDAKTQALLDKYNDVDIEEMEWAINRDILFGKKTNNEGERTLQTQERKIQEAFEYLRLSFSNWFSSDEVSGELRKQVEDIIFQRIRKYPLFERRKRLEILLSSTILGWMDTKEEFTDEQKSLLRVDCRAILEQKRCTGQCVWKQDAGKCLLHTPQGDDPEINVPYMLMRRLFEELLRYPERRKQLLERQVSPLVSLRDPLLIGNEYIIPQSSLAWYDLLHVDWSASTKEKKKFFEEMSRNLAAVPIPPPKEENKAKGELPQDLLDMFGEKEDSEGLYLYRPDLVESVMPSVRPFLVSLGVFESDIGLEDEASVLTDDAMRQLVILTRKPVIQINLQGGEISYLQFGPAKKQKDPTPFVLVAMDIDQGGPAMLSLSPTAPIAVPVDRLPPGLKYLYDERDLVSDS